MEQFVIFFLKKFCELSGIRQKLLYLFLKLFCMSNFHPVPTRHAPGRADLAKHAVHALDLLDEIEERHLGSDSLATQPLLELLKPPAPLFEIGFRGIKSPIGLRELPLKLVDARDPLLGAVDASGG
jgi:hypothetical protein